MTTRLPGFRAKPLSPGVYRFEGHLQPTPDSPMYAVRIDYEYGRVPKVWVKNPELAEGSPHRWGDGSLCLFHPARLRWGDHMLVVDYIMPWTAAWLYFYEGWRDLGVWLGPEAHESSSERTC